MKSFLKTATLLFCLICMQAGAAPVLQATIDAHSKNPADTPEKIQPGSLIKLSTTIKNTGNEPNKQGKLALRFVFPSPLDTHKKSLAFETETIELPSLKPNEEITLEFQTNHRWPTLFDYVREDWAMREYQAVAKIDLKDYVIGTRAVAFTAHYYPGHAKKKPIEIPSK